MAPQPSTASVSLGKPNYDYATKTLTFSESPMEIVNPPKSILEEYGVPMEAWKATEGGKKKKVSKPKATKKK